MDGPKENQYPKNKKESSRLSRSRNRNSNKSSPNAHNSPSTIDKISQIVKWAEQFMVSSSNVPSSKLHFLLNNARLAIKHRPSDFLSEPAFVELIDYLREINKDNKGNNNSRDSDSDTANVATNKNSLANNSRATKVAANASKVATNMAANKNKHTFKITASYPADALEDKSKLALLPFPVTIEFRPDIYPDGDILFFGDWFRVKDQAEAFEVAEEVEKFVRELIEALNLMPMKSD